jgi:hypothetical protein
MGISLKISERTHTYESFIDELIEYGLSENEHLKIICYTTNEAEWTTQTTQASSLLDILSSNNVEIKNLGEIKKLVAHYFDYRINQPKAVTYFSFLDSQKRLLLCFTNANGYDISHTLDKIVERNPGIYNAFLGPPTMIKVERMLFETYPDSIIKYFSAKRSRQLIFKSEIRPEYERTIEYTGLDGKSALEEIKHLYGVTPRNILFEIPNFAVYRIHTSGQFTMAKGVRKAKRYLLKIVDFALEDALSTRKTIESSSFKQLPIETQRKVLLFPKLTPWQITFSSKVDFDEGEDLVEILKNNNFDLFGHVLEKGSLTLNGMITDRLKDVIFTIDANSNRLIVAPLQQVSFDSFLRFYQVVIENFDPNAGCDIFE